MPRPLFFHLGIGSVRVCNLSSLCKVVYKIRTLSILIRHALLDLRSCDLILVAAIPSPRILNCLWVQLQSIAGSYAATAAYYVDLSQVKSLGSLYNLS